MKIEWEVWSAIQPNGRREHLGNILTNVKNFGEACMRAKEEYPSADAVWVVGESFGGTIK